MFIARISAQLAQSASSSRLSLTTRPNALDDRGEVRSELIGAGARLDRSLCGPRVAKLCTGHLLQGLTNFSTNSSFGCGGINDAEREHSQSDLVAAQLEVARLRAALATGSDPLASFEPPDGASPALVATQRQFLLDQTAEQRAKLAALERQQGQKEAERATSAAMIKKIERLIPVLQQQLEIRKTLFEHETGSKVNYLQAMQALIEQQQELEVQRSRQREAENAVAAIQETRAQAVAEYRRTRYDDLTKAEQKAAGFAQDVVKALKRAALQLITAPVDGVVQQLAVHTVGGIVTPAQPLLVVVPAGSRLEIEAMVSNRDIGFVQLGQEAEIKVQTFNFTRYGLLRGQVLTVSPDAVGRDPAQSPDKPQGTDARTGGTSESPDSVYVARALRRLRAAPNCNALWSR
jgi:hemolysin D